MRLGLAFRAFFRTLGNADTARRVGLLLDGQQPGLPGPGDAVSATSGGGKEASAGQTGSAASTAAPAATPARGGKPAGSPSRSDALTLLAALQREARFVDLVHESLDGYTDAQIGAAARDVLRDCRKTLDRMFQLTPLLDQPEASAIDVPAGYDPNRFRVVGASSEPPCRGQLVHPGWRATQCQLPTWQGAEASALVVAPAEVEIR
jgi:hypothetical protein